MHPPPLAVMDYVGPALGALLFVAVMSLVAEPARRTLNAIILAGASGVYLSGGFGLWELIYPVIGAAIGFRALQSYRWIAVGWLIHAGWDIVHHLWGNPIWPFMPTSAFGCMIFDSMIAPCVPRRCAIVPEAPARRDARRPCLNDGYAEPLWSAVDDRHVPFVVALAGGRREVVQPFDLVGAQLDAVGGGVLLDAGNPLGAGNRSDVVTLRQLTAVAGPASGP